MNRTAKTLTAIAMAIAALSILGYGPQTLERPGSWYTKGGFFHDGRFATLEDVVRHYENVFDMGFTGQDRRDLVEYLRSL